jgi:teichuronic acid biosynthesis glycosyltransferase TuaG
MPIYNGIEFIEESVSSIIKQTYTDWELIIGINGHPSDSEIYKKAKEYSSDKIKVYDLIDIQGKSNSLNEMLKYSNFNWVSLLDVDDIWLPNKLESQIPYMGRYDIIGTQCEYFGDIIGSPNIPLRDITLFDFYKTNPVINSSCLVKKELCYWNDDYKLGLNDYDMWLRLWKQNYKFYNVETIQVLHRIHKQSAFNNTNNNRVEKLINYHKSQ